jgi:hypothetical protein
MTKKLQYIDIEIDKLTNSLENVITGDSFPTDIVMTDIDDFKSITKKADWLFNWKAEFKKPDRDVYKLNIVNNQTVIQGLISLSVKTDHVYMHLIESAPFNKGKDKVYAGVPGNLVAFACRLSFQRGFQGYLSFLSKTNLITHYEKTLGATHVGGNLMIINTISALRLINKYFDK